MIGGVGGGGGSVFQWLNRSILVFVGSALYSRGRGLGGLTIVLCVLLGGEGRGDEGSDILAA